MALVLPKIPGRRLSTGGKNALRTEPALGIRLHSLQQALEPGELLEFEYCLHRVARSTIERLEISVVWYTEGKGSEDIGVHFFQTLSGEELTNHEIEHNRRVSTTLPASPLSYEGRMIKIRWCVRLRLYLAEGREVAAERTFYLGNMTSEI